MSFEVSPSILTVNVVCLWIPSSRSLSLSMTFQPPRLMTTVDRGRLNISNPSAVVDLVPVERDVCLCGKNNGRRVGKQAEITPIFISRDEYVAAGTSFPAIVRVIPEEIVDSKILTTCILYR